MTYIWLPYMIIPIYAGLERIAGLAALTPPKTSARSQLRTFRKVILPLVFPAVIAGSIFTFSLTLGDYIAPAGLVSNQFIGNLVYSNITNICRWPRRSPPSRS